MSDRYGIEVERIAFGFYTWKLWAGDDCWLGSGTKTAARNAVARFLLKHDAKAVQ